MVEVLVDGIRKEVEKGKAVRELLEELELKVDDKMLIAEKKEEKEIEIEKYDFDTNNGVFTTSIDLESWKASYKEWEGAEVNWRDSEKVVFGPMKFDVEMKEVKKVKRKEGDVFLLKSSPDSEDTFLCFAISDHDDISLVPKEKESEEGRIGRVNIGFLVLKNIGKGDIIKKISPEYKTEHIIERISLGKPIEEDMTLFSHLSIRFFEKAPLSVEALLFYLKTHEDVFTVDEKTHTYIMAKNPVYFDIKPENNASFRERSSVIVRNEGERRNCIYIYKKNRMPQQSMNKIGKIERGEELLDIAKEGDRIVVQTEPPQAFFVGLTQKKAEERLKMMNIAQERIGDKSDDAIIVSQEPPYTMELYKQRKVKTEGIPYDELIHIQFFEEEAPKTIHYLRNITGLYRNYPIGKLQIMVATDSLVLFKSKGKKEAIMHENLATDVVEEGLVGVTNMSRPNYGIIGIRLKRSDRYSPTGEPLESTNIVGIVKKGLERVKKIKKGVIWFKDVTPSS